MTTSIGRAGLTLPLNGPMSVVNKGGLLATHGLQYITLSGSAGPLSPVSDIVRLRDQLLGLDGNPDETVVPVIVDSEPRLTGYYRLIGVAVTTDPAVLAKGWLRFTLDLEQVAGFASPMFESILTGALLSPNAVGAVAADAFYFHAVPLVNAWPTSLTEYFAGATTLYYRGIAPVQPPWLNVFGLATPPPTAAHYSIPPNLYYLGAATFEQGGSLQPVVGRQLVQPDYVNWRLSNGMLRVTPSGGALLVSHWDHVAVAWTTAKSYSFSATTGGAFTGFSGIAVLRNAPEEVCIRLTMIPSNASVTRYFMDLSLRRGDRQVRGYITSDNADAYVVARTAAEAATAITYGAVTLGGIRATSNDGDGFRYVLLSYQQAVTSDLVNGKLTQTVAAKSFDFSLGGEVRGSAAPAPDRAVDIAKQYLAAQSEKMLVVAR